MKEYYDRRAPEYDEWWHGAAETRPGWRDELDRVMAAVAMLPPARTLDVACGTGYLTERLPGEVVGLDQSARMLTEARRRLPATAFVQGDALDLPFPDGAFGRVFASYFYCHLIDGSTWPVFKRVFEPDALARELGGAVVHAGRFFVCVRA